MTEPTRPEDVLDEQEAYADRLARTPHSADHGDCAACDLEAAHEERLATEAEALTEDVLRGALEAGLWLGMETWQDGPESWDSEEADLRGIEVPEHVSTALREEVAGILAGHPADALAYVEAFEARGRSRTEAAEAFGDDFTLTRNGHGAGYWDRGLGDLGERLTKAARPYGSWTLYRDRGTGEVTVLD